MAKKNPNQYKGMAVTVKGDSTYKGKISMQLQRRLIEFLNKSQVRMTRYTFILSRTMSVDASQSPPIDISTRPESRLDFGVTVVLPTGEAFVGTLKAPARCLEDALLSKFTRGTESINATGWFKSDEDTKAETAKVRPVVRPVVLPTQKLIWQMSDLLPNLDIYIQGLGRDIARLQENKKAMEKIRAAMLAKIEHLKSQL